MAGLRLAAVGSPSLWRGPAARHRRPRSPLSPAGAVGVPRGGEGSPRGDGLRGRGRRDRPRRRLRPRTVSTARTSDLWWKNAVVYCLDVETFLDWDGDGRGDFAGLTERVDYLAGIGVSCIWLMPFHPSPNRDDGYDITDYYGVDPRLG